MHLTNALITTLVAASSVAASSPILPPQNPSSNGQYSSCSGDQECLSDINSVRAAQEGLSPLSLPSDWDSLSGPEQLFRFMNLERTSRGLNALQALSNAFENVVQTAISSDADPDPGSSLSSSWNSIWAGGSDMTPLSAMYGWMYYDGPGGFNEDCTPTDTSGCWGHRDNILASNVNVVDAGVGTDSSGSDSLAALLWQENGIPSGASASASAGTQAPESTYAASQGPPPTTTWESPHKTKWERPQKTANWANGPSTFVTVVSTVVYDYVETPAPQWG